MQPVTASPAPAAAPTAPPATAAATAPPAAAPTSPAVAAAPTSPAAAATPTPPPATAVPSRTGGPTSRVAVAATPPEDAAVVDRFLRAVVEADEATLLALLDPDVWLRAMLVREVIEEHDAVATLARFHGWFGSAVAREVLHAATSPVASRHHVAYRFLLRPAWAPDVWHLIEQSGYARVRDGRISRLDLVCTGFHPQA
jgi:hypothetical protein